MIGSTENYSRKIVPGFFGSFHFMEENKRCPGCSGANPISAEAMSRPAAYFCALAQADG